MKNDRNNNHDLTRSRAKARRCMAAWTALVLTLAGGSLVGDTVTGIFWFFTYRFTAAPILLLAPVFALLGAAVPLAVYRSVARFTIVERLREAER